MKIIICGAGPTGLTLGCLLKTKGHDVTIIEKDAKASSYTKALMIHAATLDTFEYLEIIDDIMAQGIKQDFISFHVINDTDYIIDFRNLEYTKYPFYINLIQPKVEAILENKFISLGGTLIRNCEMINFESITNTINIKCNQDGQLVNFTADYFIGCDGASSPTRKLLGIEYEGVTYPFSYILAEGNIIGDVPNNESAMYITDNIILSALPMEDGQYRIAGPGLMNNNEMLTEEQFNELLSSHNLNFLQLKSFKSLRNYQINERTAQKLVESRVILCGDAGHIHSPTGGQAMNLGIMDAFSLFWRFSENSNETDECLRQYNNERLHIAKAVIKKTHLFNIVKIMRDGNRQEKENLKLNISKLAKDFSQLFYHIGSESPSNDSNLSIGVRIPNIKLSDGSGLWSKIINQTHITLDPAGNEIEHLLSKYFNTTKITMLKLRPDMVVKEIA